MEKVIKHLRDFFYPLGVFFICDSFGVLTWIRSIMGAL